MTVLAEDPVPDKRVSENGRVGGRQEYIRGGSCRLIDGAETVETSGGCHRGWVACVGAKLGPGTGLAGSLGLTDRHLTQDYSCPQGTPSFRNIRTIVSTFTISLNFWFARSRWHPRDHCGRRVSRRPTVHIHTLRTDIVGQLHLLLTRGSSGPQTVNRVGG